MRTASEIRDDLRRFTQWVCNLIHARAGTWSLKRRQASRARRLGAEFEATLTAAQRLRRALNLARGDLQYAYEQAEGDVRGGYAVMLATTEVDYLDTAWLAEEADDADAPRIIRPYGWDHKSDIGGPVQIFGINEPANEDADDAAKE